MELELIQATVFDRITLLEMIQHHENYSVQEIHYFVIDKIFLRKHRKYSSEASQTQHFSATRCSFTDLLFN